VGAFAGGDGVKQFADFLPELFPGSFGGFAEQSFEFGEEFFDGVQIGRIGRQIEQRGTDRGEGRPDPFHFMAAEVIRMTMSRVWSVGHRNCSTQARKSSPSMGPSTTRGAVRRWCRRAAIKVVVCQWPRGAEATQRQPLGARP
jgi:hypothetical protein